MTEKEISSLPSGIMKVQDIPSRVKGIVVLSHFFDRSPVHMVPNTNIVKGKIPLSPPPSFPAAVDNPHSL